MNLSGLLKIFADRKCNKVYIKKLAPNDNSKNQVYVGESFEVLNIFPVQEILSDDGGNWKEIRFKAKINFFWVNNEGLISEAPSAQFILYPNYPEVRFSGFLKGSRGAPSELMTSRNPDRLLFLGVTSDDSVLGHVIGLESAIYKEFESFKGFQQAGVFKEITIVKGVIQSNPKEQLISELRRIHNLGWINSKRLDNKGKELPCSSSNCGGYTLEAELGITPNGFSEPDYLGWELKQFSVKDFSKLNTSVITLMTPEPNEGLYKSKGIEYFIRAYGYHDKMGREARINFGGIHKYDLVQAATGLKLIIEGFDIQLASITKGDGFIGLIDKDDNLAASWDFKSLLKHWNTKHANACYVPSQNRKSAFNDSLSIQQYRYGNKILLCQNTQFSSFLSEVAKGNVYYDPGIKLELPIAGVRKQNIKRRSQFRIKSLNIPFLYETTEEFDLR